MAEPRKKADSPKKTQPKAGIRFVKAAIWLLIVVILFAGGGIYWANRTFHQPAAPSDTEETIQTIVVHPGEGTAAVANRLADKKLIRYPKLFELMARRQGKARKIKTGEYTVSGRMSPQRILDLIVSGRVREYRLTIPEGFRLTQIAERVERAGFVSAIAFLETAGNPVVISRLGLPETGMEGYLFPDTYHFPKGVTAEKIIRTMVSRFRSVYSDKWKQRTVSLGMTENDIVTLASIIEKETGRADERPVISSVFHNRLKRGMPLATDPTVIYGIENFDGNITKKHLRAKTPYNTYLFKGLPPTPIASPGRDALYAALYPAATKYLYFVAKGDGSHYFSKTLAEHNRAVRKYQLRR